MLFTGAPRLERLGWQHPVHQSFPIWVLATNHRSHRALWRGGISHFDQAMIPICISVNNRVQSRDRRSRCFWRRWWASGWRWWTPRWSGCQGHRTALLQAPGEIHYSQHVNNPFQTLGEMSRKYEYVRMKNCNSFTTEPNFRSCWRPSLCMWQTLSKRRPISPTCVIARRPRRLISGSTFSFAHSFTFPTILRMPDDLREGKDRMIFGNLESIFEWHRE